MNSRKNWKTFERRIDTAKKMDNLREQHEHGQIGTKAHLTHI